MNSAIRTALVSTACCLGLAFSSGLVACSPAAPDRPAARTPYRIVPTEDSGAAQLRVYAILDQNPATDVRKRAYLLEMYEQATKHPGPGQTSAPSAILTYLYTSEKQLMEDTAAFIARLSKTAAADSPAISIRSLQPSAASRP